MSALLVVIVALPGLAALFAAMAGAGRSRIVARVSTLASGLAFVLAVALAIDIALHGSVSAVLSHADGRAIIGFSADRVTVVLLLLVCGVSAVVQAFAVGYLRGDARIGRFFAATSLLTAATEAMVSGATLVGLGVAWTLAGVALCLLLNMYSGLPAARQGVHRTALAFALGDSALWLAIALAVVNWGNLDLRHLRAQVPTLTGDSSLVAVFACLVLVAALARSAQVPLQRWLPATLATPTPVSAVLHAGVINAGGVLLVRMSPLFGASGLASTLAFGFGAVTVLYGTVLMLAKPDIKGALAHSTMGQMGFMIMTCGLGAFAAAVFHLVAHGMYKATLFLGSGGAVHRHVRHIKAPPRVAASRVSMTLAACLSFVWAGAAVFSAASLLHPHIGGRTGSGALLVFAWTTAAGASWGLLRRRPPVLPLTAGLAGVLLATWAYVAWLRVFTSFLAVDLNAIGQNPASPWLLAVLLPALALIEVVRRSNGARLRSVHDRIYVFALTSGHVALRGDRERHPANAPPAAWWASLGAGPEAARA